MTRPQVIDYFREHGITLPIPRKGQQVLRVFPKYEGREPEAITNHGQGVFTIGAYQHKVTL